jgi:hypothetical protein
MRVTAVEIRTQKWGNQHTLGLDRATSDALATYCRLRWPSNTAKHAAREWELSLDEARGIVGGRASRGTLDKVWKHPRGGWSVVFPVLGAVIGQTAETFLQQEQANHAALARRHATLVRDFRALRPDAAGHDGELATAPAPDRRVVVRRLGQGRNRRAEG